MLRRFTARVAPQGASDTPDTPDTPETPELLAAIRRIPRDELPDGAARDALIEAVRCGEVDGVYRPLARDRHTITLAGLPADVDPRITVAQWATWWLDGKSPSDELLAEHAAAVARWHGFWSTRQAEQAQPTTLGMLTPNARRQFERGERLGDEGDEGDEGGDA